MRFHNMLLSAPYKEKLVVLVIDEAHCVKTWGDDFRIAFSRIGELQSLVPSHVNVLALTATATHKTLQVVCDRLSLRDVVLIALPPNIMYRVQPLQTLDEITTSLSIDLRNEGIEFPKTIIFCREYKDCSQLYMNIRMKLDGAFFKKTKCA